MAKQAPGPLEYLRRWPLRAWVTGVVIFLYAPLVSLMVFSFNDSKRNVVWKGFTLKYYGKALTDESLLTALANSLTILGDIEDKLGDKDAAGEARQEAASLRDEIRLPWPIPPEHPQAMRA